MSNPSPINRESTVSVRQGHHQVLIGELYFGSVHNQANLLSRIDLYRDPLTRNRFVPIAQSQGGVVQQAVQVTRETGQHSQAEILPAIQLRQTDRL